MDLAERWARLGAALGPRPAQPARPGWEAVGRRLVGAYADPRRGYHDVRHLTEVLEHVDELAEYAARPGAVRLAAWFHDAVHDGGPDDEERSAQLAAEELAAVDVEPWLVAEVVRLVRLTATHDPAADDVDGVVLCDADLAVLARDDEGYRAYVSDVRREYAHVPDADFRSGRAAVLAALLARPQLFGTLEGRTRWEAAARRNMEAELVELTAT